MLQLIRPARSQRLTAALIVALCAVFLVPSASADRIRSSATLFSGKSDPGQSWDSNAAAEYQRVDGQWVKADSAKPTSRDTPATKSDWKHDVQVDLFGAGDGWSAEVWEASNEYGKITGPGASANAKATGELNYSGDNLLDTRLRLSASAGAEAHLASAEGKVDGTWGSDDTNVGIGVNGKASVLAEAKASALATINRNEFDLNGALEAFAGAKASAKIPLAARLCYLLIESVLKGEASAGIGGKLTGKFKVEWSQMKAQLSGKAAATLGLGAGAGVAVNIDFSKLASNPDAVLDCLKGKLDTLAEEAMAAGQSLLSTTQELAQSGVAWAEKEVMTQVDRATTAINDASSFVVNQLFQWLNPDPCSR